MKSSTTRWTTAFAAAALLVLPAAGWSQTPATPSPAPSAQQPAPSEHGQHGAAQEHIRQAKTALNDVPAASIPASAKNRIGELKRHLNALEKSAGASTTKKATWANDVAAIDKILTELLGPATTSGASEAPGATGTTGAARSTSKATLDETTKSKLMEVRTHVTAFASAMSGAGGATPGAAEPASAAAPTTDPSSPAQSSAASSAQSSSTPSEQQSSSTQQPAPSTTGSQAAQSAAPSTETSQPQPAQAGSSQGDPQEAKRHLTAARESLSQLTQLPAAAQLQGEARTQVSQLITNFNELITTNSEWRASFQKVDANITALLGPESADPAQAQEPAPAQPPAQSPAGTPGAVGTSGAGAMNLDPAIRAKLVEFRTHLAQFEKAAVGGSTSSSSTTGSSSTSSPMTASSMGTTSSTTAPAATTGSSAATTSTTTAAEGAPAASAEHSQSASQQPAASGQDSALRHIEAIEAIVGGRSGSSSTGSTGAANPTGTTGSSAASASGITLDRTQVEQIRMHLAELRKAVEKK